MTTQNHQRRTERGSHLLCRLEEGFLPVEHGKSLKRRALTPRLWTILGWPRKYSIRSCGYPGNSLHASKDRGHAKRWRSVWVHGDRSSGCSGQQHSILDFMKCKSAGWSVKGLKEVTSGRIQNRKSQIIFQERVTLALPSSASFIPFRNSSGFDLDERFSWFEALHQRGEASVHWVTSFVWETHRINRHLLQNITNALHEEKVFSSL